MKYTAVFFDLDGTLTDSGTGIIRSFRYAFEKMGLPMDETEDISSIIGPPLSDSFLRFGTPSDRVEEAVRTYRERYLTIGKYENDPYPGIRDLLIRLKDDGLKLYVATSKPEAIALDILNHFNLAVCFDGIAGATFDSSRVSKQDVIAYLISKENLSEQAVMIGDTEFDITGARKLGLDGIGVSWGYGNIEAMRSAGAVSIADTMDDLYTMITGFPARTQLSFPDFGKADLYFPDEKRISHDVKINDHAVLQLLDKNGMPQRIRIQITRNTCFASGSRWIYGKLLDYDDFYVQVEIRLHEDPKKDTIEAFPCASPIAL